MVRKKKRKAGIGRVLGVILSVCMIAGNISVTHMQGRAASLAEDVTNAPHQNHRVCSDIEYCIDADGNKHSSTNNCSHTVVTWTAWGNGTGENMSLPAATGNYYLENDVILTSTWEPADGTVLCLNGHSISGDVSDTLITINASFALTDCRGDVGSIKNSGGRVVYIPGAGSIFEFYGGRLTGEFKGIGAGIYMKDNGTLNMYGGVIEHCVAAWKGDSDYKYSSSGKGGGVYMSGGYFNMYGGSILNNNGAQSSIQDAPYGAVYGAGIYESGGYFMMYGGAVTGNYAANTGGGLYEGSSYGADRGHQYANTIYNGTISDNVARLKGGGIYLCNTDDLNIRGGLISGNQCKDTAEGQGGGICTNGWLYIYAGSISNNKAANGGGIYVISGAGETNFYGGEIVGNEAYANGGGVCNCHYFGMNMKERINSQDVVYGGGKISGNKAVNGGGIYSTYHIGIFAGEITDNTVSGVGGGVYIGNATYYTSNRISGGKIINNYKVTQNEDGTEAKSNNNLYEYNEADSGYAMYGYFCISSALDDIRIGISTHLIPSSEDDTSSIVAAMSTDKNAYEIQETDIIGIDGSAKLFADDSANYTVAYDADNKRVYLKKNVAAAESTDTPYSFSVRLVETENSVAATFNDSNVESAIVEDSEKVDNTAIEADFTVEKISETEENKARVASAVANANITAVAYYDISLTKNVTKSGVSEEPVNISKTREDTTISITVPIPETMKGGTASEYKVVRIHNDAGTVTTELLTDTVYSADNNTVTFTTDRFSIYALAYTPTATSTSDNDEGSTKPSSKEDDSTTQASTESSTTTQASTESSTTTQASTESSTTTQATTGDKGATQATTGSQGTSQASTENNTSPSRASTESSTYSTQPSKESKNATQTATESNTSPSRASIEGSSTAATVRDVASNDATVGHTNSSVAQVEAKPNEIAVQNITLINDSNNIEKDSANESITERSMITKDAEPKTGDLRESKALVFVNIGTAAAVIYLLETLFEILCRCRKFIRIRG